MAYQIFRSSLLLCSGDKGADVGADPCSPRWLSRLVSLDHPYASPPRVRWGEVRVWYFERHQYSAGVPSQGDVALGMADTHTHTEHSVLLDESVQNTFTKQKVKATIQTCMVVLML